MSEKLNAKRLLISGIRGIPAAHGGFETFAEKLALYLVERDWDVTVYCQDDVARVSREDMWQGVKRVHLPSRIKGAAGTLLFDAAAIARAWQDDGLLLTLGYNTALFNAVYRLSGRAYIINMDGMEWQREKWSGLAKLWLWLNERAAIWSASHMIADHPKIAEHLLRSVPPEKVSMIPYGADTAQLNDVRVKEILHEWQLSPGQFNLVVARIEPENRLLDIVSAVRRIGSAKLVVLGKLEPNSNPYHRAIKEAAGDNVLFLGAVYEKEKVQALRRGCAAYIHGHTVGGTNPSLVEAMAAGCAIVASDNEFNRWVAGEGARYFSTGNELAGLIDLITRDPGLRSKLGENARNRFESQFTWKSVLQDYKALLSSYL